MNKKQFLAMSLPHELRVYVKYSHSPDNSELETLYGIVDGRIITNQFEEDIAPLPISNYGVVLHHLSDLTKQITHKGETFVPMEKIELSQLDPDIVTGWIKAELLIFKNSLKLIEWHFDIAGLIEKGEAIDVNTLEINPYK